jgi:hypothetical protein
MIQERLEANRLLFLDKLRYIETGILVSNLVYLISLGLVRYIANLLGPRKEAEPRVEASIYGWNS